MPQRFEPKTAILPPPQREIWPQFAPTRALSFVLYGGTAIALQLGHRQSLDFDFFRADPLDKQQLKTSFAFVHGAQIIQEDPNSLVISAQTMSGSVRVSFFGAIDIGHIEEPLETNDGVLLVASPEDLLATKLKAILDRAEAKDYRDISALVSTGLSLERSLAAAGKMFGIDPALPLRALGFFKDGDLPSLPKIDQDILRGARDRVSEIPETVLKPGLFSPS